MLSKPSEKQRSGAYARREKKESGKERVLVPTGREKKNVGSIQMSAGGGEKWVRSHTQKITPQFQSGLLPEVYGSREMTAARQGFWEGGNAQLRGNSRGEKNRVIAI